MTLTAVHKASLVRGIAGWIAGLLRSMLSKQVLQVDPALMSLQRQNLLLAMAAPCARASSLPQITSESMPLEPTWMLNPQSTCSAHEVFFRIRAQLHRRGSSCGHALRVLHYGRTKPRG
jgi:hypothetical protein